MSEFRVVAYEDEEDVDGMPNTYYNPGSPHYYGEPSLELPSGTWCSKCKMYVGDYDKHAKKVHQETSQDCGCGCRGQEHEPDCRCGYEHEPDADTETSAEIVDELINLSDVRCPVCGMEVPPLHLEHHIVKEHAHQLVGICPVCTRDIVLRDLKAHIYNFHGDSECKMALKRLGA